MMKAEQYPSILHVLFFLDTSTSVTLKGHYCKHLSTHILLCFQEIKLVHLYFIYF